MHGRVFVLWILLAPAVAGAADFVDAVLGEAEARIVTAGDIALARALGLFGFTPSPAAITGGDVERLLHAWLVVVEARRLGIGGSPDALDAAWPAAAARLSG
ncbi:MAG: hypothetical protein ACREJG_01275, partial [Candidatus Rokuibacteriota bacterium]